MPCPCNEIYDYDYDYDCVWWSDEAHFHLNGQVNRQNYRFWAERLPEEVLDTPLHTPKVTVWCALSSQGIIGPFFFENGASQTSPSIPGANLPCSNTSCGPARSAKCTDTLNQQWLQQDGATAHTSRANLAWLHERLEGRLISRRAAVTWPPHSPDLTPLDFYLRGCLKSVVYQEALEDLATLKRAIHAAVHVIPPSACARVAEEARCRAERSVAQKGRHFEHVPASVIGTCGMVH